MLLLGTINNLATLISSHSSRRGRGDSEAAFYTKVKEKYPLVDKKMYYKEIYNDVNVSDQELLTELMALLNWNQIIEFIQTFNRYEGKT